MVFEVAALPIAASETPGEAAWTLVGIKRLDTILTRIAELHDLGHFRLERTCGTTPTCCRFRTARAG